MSKRALSGAFALAVLLSSIPAFADRSAFIGAVGFGAGAIGWRGGELIAVTSLDDSGPGTLRDCVEQDFPRVCIFRVSGTIELDSRLRVRSNVYIAGQTAPGDGVQLRLREGFRSPLFIQDASDVVVRHLKIRPGPGSRASPAVDAVTLVNAQNVYLDHLSMMFATDENLNVHVNNGTSSNITVSNSIIAFGLDRANHPNGRHSKGALICSKEGGDNQCGRITLFRNLFSSNSDRNPDIKGTSIGPIEVVNNVFYNARSQFGEFYNSLGETRIAYVGNIALAGPSTIDATPAAVQAFEFEPNNTFDIFAEDNRFGTLAGCENVSKAPILDNEAERFLVDESLLQSATPVIASEGVLQTVLGAVGDQIGGQRQPDPLDWLVFTHVVACGGHVIDSVEEVGGWPEPSEQVVDVQDRDADGLPDAWEDRYPWADGDNPDDAWNEVPGLEYSSVDLYLSSLARDLDQIDVVLLRP